MMTPLALLVSWMSPIAVADPAPAVQIRPTLQAAGEVEFRVIDRADKGVPYVRVKLRRAGEVHEVRTDNRGRIAVSDLPQGTYEVQFRRGRFVTLYTTIDVEARPESPIEVALPRGSAQDSVCLGPCPDRRRRGW